MKIITIYEIDGIQFVIGPSSEVPNNEILAQCLLNERCDEELGIEYIDNQYQREENWIFFKYKDEYYMYVVEGTNENGDTWRYYVGKDIGDRYDREDTILLSDMDRIRELVNTNWNKLIPYKP